MGNFKIEIGSALSYEGEINNPTPKAFLGWLNTFRGNVWFADYDFIIVGNFAAILDGQNLPSDTWDIDIIILRKEAADLDEIKTIISYGISLGFEHKIFVDMYYKEVDELFDLDENFIENYSTYASEYCYAYGLGEQIYVDDEQASEYKNIEQDASGLWKRHERIVPWNVWTKYNKMPEEIPYLANINLKDL